MDSYCKSYIMTRKGRWDRKFNVSAGVSARNLKCGHHKTKLCCTVLVVAG
jgi:hypothetical protein